MLDSTTGSLVHADSRLIARLGCQDIVVVTRPMPSSSPTGTVPRISRTWWPGSATGVRNSPPIIYRSTGLGAGSIRSTAATVTR